MARLGIGFLLGAFLMGTGCQENVSLPPLAYQLVLGDESFCPGGGPEARDQVDVLLQVRSLSSDGHQVTGLDAAWVLRREPEGQQPVEVARRKVRFLGRFGSRFEYSDIGWKFPPPRETGRYRVAFQISGQEVTSRAFEVWYDQQACPDPSGAPVPEPTSDPTPDATGQAETGGEPPPERLSPVDFRLERDWKCDDSGGLADLQIRITVTHNGRAQRALRVPGLEVKGIPELDPLERVAGELEEGYLLPGASVSFQAHGWAETGRHPVPVRVPGLEGARALLHLETSCP